jgi:hypothetical protein
MKTPDELDRLLNDVLAPEAADEFRGATLQTTLAAVQRRKRRRSLARKAALIALPVVLAGGLWWLQPTERTQLQQASVNPQPAATAPAQFIPGTDIRLISDEELFALFPDRPLALIGPKGHQQLVFLDTHPAGTSAANTENLR